MSAANWPILYQFESALSAAIVDYLRDYEVTAYAARSDETVIAPYVAVLPEIGANLAQFYRHPENGEPFAVAWAFRLKLGVGTVRRGTTTEHDLLLGTLRWLMQDLDEINERLPWHNVAKLIETDTVHIISPEDDLDLSELSFDGVVAIKPEELPANP